MDHQAKFFTMWVTYYFGAKEGWNMAHMCGLPCIEEDYSKEPLPTA